MIDIVFYFQAHQPYRLRKWRPGDRIDRGAYYDEPLNRLVVERVAERCYVPMNRLLLDAIERTDGQFRCAFSLSGTLISQLRDWVPAALDTFVELAESGNVEFLCETSQHSLAAVVNPDEFASQVETQRAVVTDLFGEPTTFRNTELILDNTICQQVEDLGFDCMLGEGADRLLGWRSPQVPYRPKGCERLRLLLRSYSLSDDIAFRFSNRKWPAYPLFADTYAKWLHEVPSPAQFVGLFMDYETFGEHQGSDTGILDFMRHLPELVLEESGFRFRTPAQVAAERAPIGDLDIATHVSWADEERNLTAWLGNPMQTAAHDAIYALRDDVLAVADKRPDLLEAWRRLTTSDHVYYIATKHHSDAEVHDYFSPYDTPHAAFVTVMTAVDDLAAKVAVAAKAARGPVGGKNARAAKRAQPGKSGKPRKSGKADKRAQN
ncbi:MAG: glycoside hydrolase family 57 protein [bacterium]|nr:glycoside hydrolase family 57 protein [bacterium]